MKPFYHSSSIVRPLLVLALLVGSVSPMHAQSWLTNYDEASSQSKSTGRPLVLFFTGSDWCGWCKRLQAEVLTQSDFANYAGSNLILMEVDFPRGKKLPPAQQKQNEDLMKTHGVEGFPTLVFVDYNGNVKGQLGYQSGGPKKYVESIQKILR